jgi:hypothetical protein
VPKKIAGLDQKQAIILFVVVAVGVFLYLRHKGTNTAASVSAPSADKTASAYPAQAQDSTGGATSSAQDPSLDALLSQFATTPPYYYYNTGNNTTTTNTYNTPLASGTSDPSAPGGGVTTPTATAPVSSGGSTFKPSYAPAPLPIPFVPQGPSRPGTIPIQSGGSGGRPFLKV